VRLSLRLLIAASSAGVFVSPASLPAISPAVTTIVVAADRPGAPIAKTMVGVFFEDINFAADGGLYPERVKNRSFEFPDPLLGWKRAVPGAGTFEARTDNPPSARNTHYLRVTSHEVSRPFGVMNDGFRGVGVEAGKSYVFSLLARRVAGGPSALRVEVKDTGGRAYATARVEGLSAEWARYAVTLTPQTTQPAGRLALMIDGKGAVDVDMVSLFPTETYKNRPGGLRRDLGEKLEALRPGFLRFPGGCIVEGRYLEMRYQWKTTIGEPADRTLIVNRWNDEFVHKPAPDYFQSFGLGFFEYFQLAEDLGAEPMPILNCGMACQYNSGELVPMDGLDPYIQDALDLIEFANGPVTSVWGKRRADLGHPAPFGMKLLGVGNEQWGPEYAPRFIAFKKALEAKYPDVQLIASGDPRNFNPAGDAQWAQLRDAGADIVDDHYYKSPSWFYEHATLYDAYPRTGPKVFVGEYAAHVKPPNRAENWNVWQAGLAEAAFLTGLERNADVIRMTAYAPLFAHTDAWQWTPNLIWFDNLRSYATPSYYVQQLFAANRGATVIPVTKDGKALTGQGGLFASAALDDGGGIIVKIVNIGEAPAPVRFETATRVSGKAHVTVIAAPLMAENSLVSPDAVKPFEEDVTVTAGVVEWRLPAHSVTVLRIPR
jgi:alpha-N-arabinofuranosidase